MRRILLVLTLFLSMSSVRAIEHIRFHGVELGDYESFKDSLVAKGFSYMNSFETQHSFYGVFANEIVALCVLVSPISNTICKVIVYFPEKTDWSALKKDYFAKKNLYCQKYPLNKDYEFFSSPYEDGDGYEMRAVKMGKCNYVSFFLAVGGYITVEIDKSARLSVVYEDRENTKIAQNELEEKAIDDI